MNQIRVALALLRTRPETERAIRDLLAVGVAPSELSLLQAENGVIDHVAANGASALAMLPSLSAVVCAGVEHLVAAGPIRQVLDGSTRRTVTGTLRALGATEERAAMLEGRIRDGATLLGVHTAEGRQIGEARRIFALHGGYEISVNAPPPTAAALG